MVNLNKNIVEHRSQHIRIIRDKHVENNETESTTDSNEHIDTSDSNECDSNKKKKNIDSRITDEPHRTYVMPPTCISKDGMDDNRSLSNGTNDEISFFLSKIQNKYSDNAEQKHLNQLYDIGILCVNKNFNQQKLVEKITKIIEERSQDSIKRIRDNKRAALINAFKKGIEDASSDTYRLAYDDSNRYQYDSEKLKKRAHIDGVLNNF